MKRIGVAGGVLAALLLACSSAVAKPSPSEIEGRSEALAHAEGTWEEAAISDYRYRIRYQCFCPRFRREIVVVHDGKPEPTRQPYRRYNTVPKLFNLIGKALEADGLDVKYSARYGVPRSIAIDYSFMIADEEQYFVIDRFRVLSG